MTDTTPFGLKQKSEIGQHIANVIMGFLDLYT